MKALSAPICGCLCALLAAAAPAIGSQDAPKLPKPVRVPPTAMPALPPAIIDDTLAIAGEEIDARKVQRPHDRRRSGQRQRSVSLRRR